MEYGLGIKSRVIDREVDLRLLVGSLQCKAIRYQSSYRG